jgi:hypothetical protein
MLTVIHNDSVASRNTSNLTETHRVSDINEPR